VKPLLLTFDVEEFDWVVGPSGRLPLEDQVAVTANGLREMLPVLDRHRAPATFFVTGVFARRATGLISEIAKAGHEVAVHGLDHADAYARIEPSVAVDRLRRARAEVEAAAARPARGLRTPRLSRCQPAVVREAGFSYDASIHPTWIPGRSFGLHLPRRPWREHSVTMVPISVPPVVRIPVSWQLFQLVGPRLGKAALGPAAWRSDYLHLYFHPWEAVKLSTLGVKSQFTRRTGPVFLETLDTILRWSQGRFAATTIEAFLGLDSHRCQVRRFRRSCGKVVF
jgi:peptidoglycan/xylan/chitin deacetylase (PgdA/CDA1 family)